MGWLPNPLKEKPRRYAAGQVTVLGKGQNTVKGVENMDYPMDPRLRELLILALELAQRADGLGLRAVGEPGGSVLALSATALVGA
jgi:hypothetical protein